MKKLILLSTLFALTSQYTMAQSQNNCTPSVSKSSVSSFASDARFKSYMDLAHSMRDYVTPLEYQELYIPLRMKAAKAQITLSNFGALSKTTHDAMYELVRFIIQNETQFETLWQIDAFFNTAMDLFNMVESLKRDLI
jgi:hypothetical protein